MTSLSLHGVVPILKPPMITSAQALNHLKEKLITELMGKTSIQEGQHLLKMGHGGTLDSTATGVLAVGIGDGCQKLKCFLHGEKTYIAKCQLGQATDTYNHKGRIIMEKPFEHVTEKMLELRLNQFLGRIQQVPPAFSALKKKGKRYSDLTREGINFKIHPRAVHCYELKIKDFTPPFFTLSIASGPGFYVRSLIHDLGLAVESCAHICELQRTKQGPFTLQDALPEQQWTVRNITKSISKHKVTISKYYRSYQLGCKKDQW